MDSPAGADRPIESWGHTARLFRGAAHEINNQLGAILAYADLIALSPGCSADIAGMAKEISAAVRSGAAQLDTIAALVTDDLTTVETLQLNELLLRVSDLFRFEFERAGSIIDVHVPAGSYALLGVRARIVRALAHALRLAAGSGTPESRRLRVRLEQLPGKYAIEIDGCAVLTENAASLDEAGGHLAFHRGAIAVISPQSLRIEIPVDTGLKRS